MTNSLTGRRLLVTGASSGIGRAVAEAVVAHGARVGLLARSADVLETMAADLGAAAVPAPADVTDVAGLRTTVGDAAERLGGLDGLVNAAGVIRPGGITESTPEDWRVTFEVNVLGLLNATWAALPWLREAGTADIVNISSMSGRRRASVAATVYSASKHAVHVLSDGLREELAADGVRVTIISPGYVKTPIFDDLPPSEHKDHYQRALAAAGLDPALVADHVVRVLEQPPGVNVLEVAVLSTEQ